MGGGKSKPVPYEASLNVKTGYIDSNFGNTNPAVPTILDQAVRQIFQTAKNDKQFRKCTNQKKLKTMLHTIGDSIMMQYNGVDFQVSTYKKGTFCATYFVVMKVVPSGNFQNFDHVRVVQTMQSVPTQQQMQPQQGYQQQGYQQPQQLQQHQQYTIAQPLVMSPQPNAPRPKLSSKKLKKCTLVINLSGSNIFVKISRDRHQISKVEKRYGLDLNVEYSGVTSGLGGKKTKIEERENKFVQEGFENVSNNNYCQGPECQPKQPVFVTIMNPITKGCIIENKELDPFASLYVNANSVTPIQSTDAVKYLQQNKII